MSWQKALAGVANDVEQHFDRLKYRLAARLGGGGRTMIVPYLGYGNARELVVRGRVLADKGSTSDVDNDSLWDNLTDMYRRLASDELPFPRLRAEASGVVREVVGDEEGFFEALLPVVADGRSPHDVSLTLLNAPAGAADPVQATARVVVPPPGARFGVISDIDDTIMESSATNLLRMARTVFMGSARTRLPFPGVAAFYRALQGEGNPLFYLSSSPWNLYDLFMDFFELQGIPAAPLFLRDWGITAEELLPTRHLAYKLAAMRRILDFYDGLPFILLGDSGQEDPEIYAQVVQAYPGRILAVYIRDVVDSAARDAAVQRLAAQVRAAGSELLLAGDTLAMAAHAAARGWVAETAVDAVRAAGAGEAELDTD